MWEEGSRASVQFTGDNMIGNPEVIRLNPENDIINSYLEL